MTPDRPADPRALLADLYWAAVTAAAPGPALSAALAVHAPDPGQRVHLLALGKAALPMATAAVAYLAGHRRAPCGGVLVTPEPATAPHPSLTVAVGDHPQPGAGSLAASERLAAAVADVRPGDEVWVLLSGGTTSLIGAPIEGISPADLTALYRLLLASGLDISAMNRIRKRFARWAGGRLGAALERAHVKNFTISDVIGDDLGSIGSGPCVPDVSGATEIRTALVSAGLWEKIPGALREHLEAVERGAAPETPKPGDPAFRTLQTVLVASNRLALEAACGRARDLGLNAELVSDRLAGEASIVGRQLATHLLAYDATNVADAQGGGVNKDAVLVWGGETTVTLSPEAGAGGRSQELALAAGEVLATAAGVRSLGSPDAQVVLLAAGTDGRDGPTDAAGAFADAGSWRRLKASGRNPREDLARHASNAALAASGDLFHTGMTGTNVMDLVLGLIRQPR